MTEIIADKLSKLKNLVKSWIYLKNLVKSWFKEPFCVLDLENLVES